MSKMWHRDTKWANAIGKMAPVDLLLQGDHAVPSKSLQSCPTVCDPMDCSPPGFSVHGILQARILAWVAMATSLQFVKNTVSVKYNKAKHKKQGMPVICFQFNSQAAATEPKRSRRQALSCLPDFTRHSRWRRLAHGTFLVVQWLRIHLPMHGAGVRTLVGEIRCSMWRGNQAHTTKLLSPRTSIREKPSCHN